MSQRLSWNPVRRGKVYCSPRCGGGCTWEDHRVAKMNAQQLAHHLNRTMGPRGWLPRVWENLGWHWCVVSRDGTMKVHPQSFGDGFTAYFGPEGHQYWTGSGTSAYQALKAAVAACQADEREAAGTVASFVQATGFNEEV